MSIKMIRIDDRLIHGQIVTAWAKNLQISRIWIIDDGVAKDDFVKGVMQMVKPSETDLIITPVSEVETLAQKFDSEAENTLVLVKFPYVAEVLLNTGIQLRELNIGGMGASPDRKKLFKNISASQAEKDTLKSIKESGVKVYFQVTPDEKKTDFE